jgi:hypothetical protein
MEITPGVGSGGIPVRETGQDLAFSVDEELREAKTAALHLWQV